MGAITTLVPSSVASGGGSWVATGGTVPVVLGDSSDSTYVVKSGGTALLYLNMAALTVPGGHQVNRVRAGTKVYAPAPGAKQYRLGWMTQDGTVDDTMAFTSTGSNVWRYTNWTPITTALQPDLLNGLWCYLNDGGSSGTMRFTEVALYVDVIDQPTVTVSTPATGTSRPVVSWTYADGDGDPQSSWTLKVFDSATYGGGGFDPNTSIPVWTASGSSDSGSAQTGSLSNGTYRAYVQVAHATASGTPYYSAWAYAQWTVAITPPSTPSLALTWSVPTQSVGITATGAALPGGYTNQTFHIQASADGGVTWYDVRGALAAVPNGSYKVITSDYEIPRGITAKYRVQASALDGSGTPVSSVWSSVASQATTNDGTWWLVCPANTALNMGSVPVVTEPDISVEETLGVFRPLGGTKAVVVAGDKYGEDGTYVIHAHLSAELTAVAALANVQTPLLVQDPWGGQKWIRWTDRSRVIAGTVPAPRSPWTLPYVEVARPPVLS